jgi:thioredoxin reductase (NADPH)
LVLPELYDVVIVGGGPAGLTAGIYSMRGGLKTLLIEKLAPGGQIALTEAVENYPGFPEISGAELTRLMEEHARKFGVPIVSGEVMRIEDGQIGKIINTGDTSYAARTVVVASGAKPKKLGVRGEEKLIGRGVSFCAICDGRFFQNRDVCVVGGGDSAVQEALYLSKLARRVYVVHRRSQLRTEKITQEKAFSNSKIEFVWDSLVEEVSGKDKVESVLVRNVKNDKERRLDVSGVFVYVGNAPNTDFIDVKKDENDFIITNDHLETSMRGAYAAGDCRAKPLRQVVTAVGDGALAAFQAGRFIEESKQD